MTIPPGSVLTIVAALAGAVGFGSPAAPPSAPLPVVIAAEIPRYPQIARQAWLEGRVRLRVTINGGQVVALEALESNPLFDRVVLDNLRTWRFEGQGPATFETTFRFSIAAVADPCKRAKTPSEESSVSLNYPTSVEVREVPSVLCEDIAVRSQEIDVFRLRYGVGVTANPQPAFGQSRRAKYVPSMIVTRATIAGYPPAARAAGIEGTVRVRVMPTGELDVLEGPAELADSTLAAMRRWQIILPGKPDQVTFIYRLLPGDCEGGGPIVATTPYPRLITVSAKKVVPCSPNF